LPDRNIVYQCRINAFTQSPFFLGEQIVDEHDYAKG